MRKVLLSLLLLAVPAAAITIPTTEGSILDSIAGKIAHYIQGYLYIGKDSTHTTPVITLSGTDGSVNASSAAFVYNVNASSFNGTLNGNVVGNVSGTATTITGSVTQAQVTNLTSNISTITSHLSSDESVIDALGVSTNTLSISTASLGSAKVNRSGDTMTGPLTMSQATMTIVSDSSSKFTFSSPNGFTWKISNVFSGVEKSSLVFDNGGGIDLESLNGNFLLNGQNGIAPTIGSNKGPISVNSDLSVARAVYASSANFSVNGNPLTLNNPVGGGTTRVSYTFAGAEKSSSVYDGSGNIYQESPIAGFWWNGFNSTLSPNFNSGTADFQLNNHLGIGVGPFHNSNSTIRNGLDINGSIGVGSDWSGNTGAPSNGAFFEGKVATSKPAPTYEDDVNGIGAFATAALTSTLNITKNAVIGSTQSTVVSNTRFCGYPGISLLSPGNIAVVYRCGSGQGNPPWDGDLYYKISADSGVTWGSEVKWWSHNSNWSAGSVKLFTMGISSVIASFDLGYSIDGGVTVSSYTNYVATATINAGHTLTFGSTIAVNSSFTGSENQNSSRVIRLANGKLMLPVYGINTGDSFERSAVIFSTNAGLNWNGQVAIAGSGSAPHYNEMDCDIVQTPSNRIVCLIRTQSPINGYTRTVSDDNGATWSTPSKVIATDGFNAPNFLVMNSSSCLFIGGFGPNPIRTTAIMTSWDQGQTWSIPYIINSLFDRQDAAVIVSSSVVGMVYAASTRTYTSDGNSLASIYYSALLDPGFTAASTITGNDPSGYSLAVSSGISAPNGTVNAKYFVGNGGGITGLSGSLSGGTTNRIPVWTGSTSLGNSLIYENASGETVAGTMTVTGATNLIGSSFTFATTGIMSAPSQPMCILTIASLQGSANNDAFNNTFWSEAPSCNNGMWSVSGDSSAITVPVAGNYDMSFQITSPAITGATDALTMITKNGGQLCSGPSESLSAGGNTQTFFAHCLRNLAAGDVIRFQYLHNATLNTKTYGGTARDNFGSVTKVW